MIGQPKYKIDDTVYLNISDTNNNKCIKQGKIKVVDKYGTLEQKKEVSYDIYIPSDNTLYKHIKESALYDTNERKNELKITYEQFEQFIRDIVDTIELDDKCLKAIHECDVCEEPPKYYSNTRYETDIVRLLEILTDDVDSKKISYWIYECDCGKSKLNETIKYNDKIVPFKTILDLWNVLTNEI